MKAMILAAGMGSRMRHLTRAVPKPLLTVGRKCLIEYSIDSLLNAGIVDLVINVHYYAEQVIETLGDGSRYGVNIQYSWEREKLLGTGGGIANALPLLGDEPFVVMSGDIITDFPVQSLIEKEVDCAHMVMIQNPAFHRQGDFYLNEKGMISLTSGERLTYANVGVFHPKIFKEHSATTFALGDVLLPSIKLDGVTGECYNGRWDNVGTPEILQLVAADIVI